MNPLRKLMALGYRKMREAEAELFAEEMAAVRPEAVQSLREMVGASPKDCRAALAKHNGDIEKAADYLRGWGTCNDPRKQY